jgi:hypothetical protein
MPDEINTITRPTDPTPKPVEKMRVVRLDPAYCPPGSGAMVKGKSYVVGEGSTLAVPAEITDDELKADLGASLRLS